MTTKQTFRPVDEQLAALRKGVAEIIREEELRAKLERSRASGEPLRVKLGVDPTAPDLHLGHTVVLRKLKHFQDEGHTAVFLIGDVTAMVGDPTGRSEMRPPLTREQVRDNAATYLEQVYKILDRERTEVRYNSEWLAELKIFDIIRLFAHFRLARMLEHEDFRTRLAGNQSVAMHELLYPVMQAYDSVALQADVELGATEQKFNLLMGRDIQQEYGQPPQVALTMPILVGLDGQRKMSKSLGNYIGITEPPAQMFGKIMSVSDELMWSYYDLLTDRSPAQIAALREQAASGTLHPMDAKMLLAEEIVSGFHGPDAARKAAAEFQRVFRERQAPAEVPVRKVSPGPPKPLVKLLVELGAVSSRSEAERLIKQGAVEFEGERLHDVTHMVSLSPGDSWKFRVGKKIFIHILVE
jgi:tyrosyl-tRNA synthetase